MIRWLIGFVLALGLVIVGLSWYLQPDDFSGCGATPSGEGKCVKADAIVAISGGDTSARTESAIQLFKNGWGNYLIFSGAAQDKSGPSNAAAMKTQAMNEGIPSSVIYLDEYAASTEQNATNTKSIFSQLGVKSVILTTSGYHQRRAYLEFHRTDKNIAVYNKPVLTDSDWSFWWWLTPRGWWLALGELAKIAIVYITGVGSV